jgi:hypothetical protein
MPDLPLTFIYLDVGRPKNSDLKKHEWGINLEFQYSLSTLLAESGHDFQVVLYTDELDAYSRFPVLLEDIVGLTAGTLKRWPYIYRAKPFVLRHALQKYKGRCIFLDSDTYLQEGAVAAMAAAVGQGALLCSRNDYGSVPYSHETGASPPAGNSGVIGLNAECGEVVLRDVLDHIDRAIATGVWSRCLEQDAMCEVIWRHRLPLSYAVPQVVHYYGNSKRRYMHAQIRRLVKTFGEPLPPARPSIKLTRARVRLYQFFWSVRRRSGRLLRGA